jgi:hypothetical protein
MSSQPLLRLIKALKTAKTSQIPFLGEEVSEALGGMQSPAGCQLQK